MRQQWEYQVLENDDRDMLQAMLTRAGTEGWELASATASFNKWMSKVVYQLFLKRPAS